MRDRQDLTMPRWLWGDLLGAPHRLLLLDYDGTLAPLNVDRMEARPLPECKRRVAAIAAGGRTTVGIVSGRPVAELRHLLGLSDVILVGEHGWEIFMPGRGFTQHRLSPRAEEGLRAAARMARSAPWGDRVEIKRTALMLHTRGLPSAEAALLVSECGALLTDLGRAAGLQMLYLDSGLELRTTGLDKGSAVRSLMDLLPEGTYVVYLGDDRTDEDAFRVVQERGLGIRVGPDASPTRAAARLGGPPEVADFLRQWLRLVEEPSADAQQGVS